MTTSHYLGLLALLGAPALPACGHDEMMSNDIDVFRQDVQQFQNEFGAHRATVDAALDMTDVLDRESRFYAGSGNLMNGMRGAMGNMSGCMGSMTRTSSGAVLDDLDELEAVREAHWDAMQEALDRDEVRSEESRFQTAMTELMEGFNSHTDALLDEAISRGCLHGF